MCPARLFRRGRVCEGSGTCPPGSAAEQVSQDEEDVGRALGEAAHEVGIPGVAVRDVQAEAKAVGDQHALEIAADAVQHLEFEGGGGAAAAGGVLEDEVDHAGIVGGEGGILALVEEDAGEAGVAGIDVALARPSNRGRLVVGAFAKADGDAEGGKSAKVVVGAIEVGLEDGAEGAVGGVEILDEAQGAVDVFAGFHVDFDPGTDAPGFLLDGFDVGAAERVADVKAELGELDRDGGRQRSGGDGVERLFDADARGEGFIRRSDIFAQVVERGEDVLRIKAARDGDAVLEALARDETAGEAGSERRGFHPAAQGAAAGEEEKRFSQHTGLIPFHGT